MNAWPGGRPDSRSFTISSLKEPSGGWWPHLRWPYKRGGVIALTAVPRLGELMLGGLDMVDREPVRGSSWQAVVVTGGISRDTARRLAGDRGISRK